MATEIDALQLNITAETGKATKSLEALSKALRSIGDSLNVFNSMANVTGYIDTFSDAMTNLNGAVSKVDARSIKNVSNNINSLYNAMKRVTEFKGTAGVGKDIKEMAQGLATDFKFSNTEGVDQLTRSIREFFSILVAGKGDDVQAVNNIKSVIKEFSSLNGVLANTLTVYQQVRDYVSKTPIKLPKDFYKEFGDNAKFLRGVFGIANTSNSKAVGDVAELAREMNDTLRTTFDVTGTDQDIFREIAEKLLESRNEAEKLKKEYWGSKQGLEAMDTVIMDIVTNTTSLANEQRKINKEGNGGGVTNYLYDLEGINIPDFTNIKILADAITKLSGTNSTAAGDSLKSITEGLKQLEGVKIPDIGDATTLAENLRMLGSKTIRGAGEALPKIVSSLSQFNTISIPQDKIAGLTELAKSLAIFGRQTSKDAVDIMPKFATAFRQLMEQLSRAPQVSRNVIDLSNALGNFLANVRNVSGSTRQASTGLKLFGNSVSSSGKKLIDFGRIIGKFYAKWFLLLRAFRKIKDAIGIASDLKEVQNVVDTTFGQMTDKVEEFASSAVENFGMSELSAKKFASRFQAMGVAMAIPAKQIEEAQKKLNSINPELASRGYSDTANSIADMSINVTKLAADMASFYNVAQEDVAKDLEAIYTGMTRPLRQYGLDLTEATLSEWAMKNGLDANVKSMTQAEKTILRYQYVLANTSAAQGDFAKTSLTWANQVRMLGQNFQRLGAVIGNGLIAWLRPAVVAINNAMDGIIAAVQRVVNALGKIFGWEMIVDTTGKSLIEDTEEVADAWNDAIDAAKKYAKQLLGIDELNNLTTNDKGSGSGDNGGYGGMSGGNIIKPGGIEFKKFESDIDNLYDLGKKLSEAFANLLPDDWSEIYNKAANFGTGLADFLNGLIQPDTFFKVGRTIAGAIMTAITALASFSDEADWEQYGTSLGEGINGFFKEFDSEKFIEGVNKFAHGVLEAIKSALKTVDWGEAWNDITTLLTEASPETITLILGTILIKKVAKWVFGGGVINSFTSAFSAAVTASGAGSVWKFLTTDVAGLTAAGVSAGTIIATGIFGGLAAAFIGWNIGQQLYKWITGDDTDYGSFGDQLGQIVQSITDGDAGPALKLWWEDIWGGISAFFTDVWNGIVLFFSESWNTIKGQLDAVGGWFSDLNQGIKDGSYAALEFVVGLYEKAWEGIKGVWGGVVDFFGGIWEGIKKIFSVVGNFFKGIFEGAWFTITTAWNGAVSFFQGIWKGISGAFSTVVTFFGDLFKNGWNAIKLAWAFVTDFFSGIWNNIKSIFSYVVSFFKGIFEGASNAIHGVLTGLFEAIKAPINFIIDGVNILIGGLNHIKVPDWVPLVGGVGINIPLLEKFEYGGYPTQGSLFVAGETYGQSEWVGNINGRTGVVSGYEITDISRTIRDTSEAEMALMRSQNEILMGILQKEFGISKDAIGEAARSYGREYYNRTGNQAFSY